MISMWHASYDITKVSTKYHAPKWHYLSGYFSLLELWWSIAYIFPWAEKSFSFNMADLTEFFREIQKAEYFDSILVRLSVKEIDNTIPIKFEDQVKEILIGEKWDCWRQKVLLYGSCEEYHKQSKLQLINFDKFSGFFNDQI